MNKGQSRGKQVILIENGGIKLDGYLLKSVVLRKMMIIYSGGPVQLENVIFVNCTFVLENEAAQRRFATAVLSNPEVTFSA